MTTVGVADSRRLSQRRRRVAGVCWEWSKVIRSPKVCWKTWTIWLVRAISGTRRMTDFCALRASEAIWR